MFSRPLAIVPMAILICLMKVVGELEDLDRTLLNRAFEKDIGSR